MSSKPYFLDEHRERLDRVAPIAGVVIDGGDLQTFELVKAADLLGDIVDHDRGFRPIVEQQRELVGEDGAVDSVFAASAGSRERDLVGADLFGRRHIEAARGAHYEGDLRAVIAVLVALVAFEGALERVGRLAFLDEHLDAVDAAMVVHIGDVVANAGPLRDARRRIGAGAIGEQRIELLAVMLAGARRKRETGRTKQKCAEERQNLMGAGHR